MHFLADIQVQFVVGKPWVRCQHAILAFHSAPWTKKLAQNPCQLCHRSVCREHHTRRRLWTYLGRMSCCHQC